MRKRKLVILGVLVLALSLGIGTIANAEKATIEMVPQKVELESFLERVIDVDQWDYLGTSETLETLWVIEVDKVIKEGNYIIEFIPEMISQIYRIPETEVRFVTVCIGTLPITPENNVRTGARITLSVRVIVTISCLDFKETLEFVEKILKAQKDNEKISMEVEIAFASSILVDEERLEKENFPKFKVYFIG